MFSQRIEDISYPTFLKKLFVNTTVPKMVNNAMSNYEDTGIIHDVKNVLTVAGTIVADYKRINTRYFYMFKIGSKKGKRK